DLFRNGGQPFLGVVEDRVDVIHHAPERIDPVAPHGADLELFNAGRMRLGHKAIWRRAPVWIKPGALLWFRPGNAVRSADSAAIIGQVGTDPDKAGGTR